MHLKWKGRSMSTVIFKLQTNYVKRQHEDTESLYWLLWILVSGYFTNLDSDVESLWLKELFGIMKLILLSRKCLSKPRPSCRFIGKDNGSLLVWFRNSSQLFVSIFWRCGRSSSWLWTFLSTGFLSSRHNVINPQQKHGRLHERDQTSLSFILNISDYPCF